MDSEKVLLFEAARRGDIEALNNFLEENPFILVEFPLTSPKESLLHVATKAQQFRFVSELLKRNPELAYELNKDGLRPIDIASVIGNVEIVREILSIDRGIFLLGGKEKRTALHYAAIYGRIGVIDELMSSSKEGIKDVSDYGETALHLALKNNQVDGFCVLLKWVERVKMEYVINWGDCDGNTVLHIAASKKQLKSIKQLVCADNNSIAKMIEVNATNSKGLTPMDLLDIVIENPNDFHLKEILAQAGALRAQDINIPIPPQNSKNNQTKRALKSKHWKDWFEYFKFQEDRDSPSDVRNALLVVAALIVTVTFQAGVNPPNGMLQPKSPQNSLNNKLPNNDGTESLIGPGVTLGLVAASAILGSSAKLYLFLFLFANSLGLTASLSILIYLTRGFPFRRELLTSMCSMMFTYGCSISSVAGKDLVAHFLFVIAFLLPFMLRWLPWWGKKAWKWWKRMRVNQAHLPVVG